jgi:Predicted Fe-S protein
MNQPPAPIRTPCIKVCVVDGESGLCLGCFRRLNEVATWARLSETDRERIMAELPSRRALIRPEKLGML